MGLFGFKLVRARKQIQDPELEKRISDLELEFSKLKSHVISLRGFVNKKMDLPEDAEENKIDDGLNALRG